MNNCRRPYRLITECLLEGYTMVLASARGTIVAKWKGHYTEVTFEPPAKILGRRPDMLILDEWPE